MASIQHFSNEIWIAVFEQFYQDFPTRLSELRLVSHLFDALIIPICYGSVRLGDKWIHAPQGPIATQISQGVYVDINSIVTQRIAMYSQHVTFAQRMPTSAHEGNLHIQELLRACTRLKSVTCVFDNDCSSNFHQGTHIPADLREFLAMQPHIKLEIKRYNFMRESMVQLLNSVARYITLFQAYVDGRHGMRELRALLCQCPQLDSLELAASRYYGLRNLVLDYGERYPPVRKLKLSTLHWYFSPQAMQSAFDFSALEEFSLMTSEAAHMIPSIFQQLAAPKLKVLRYVAYTTPLDPPFIQAELRARLNDGMAFLPGLQILELKCDIGRVNIPQLLEQLPYLNQLDIGRHSAFQDKTVGYPMLGVKDIACLQRLDRLESLGVDLERDACDTFEFLSSLCQITTLRSLTIRSQTAKHGEYAPTINLLDQIARADNKDPDRCLTRLMAKRVNIKKCHRLAELKINLGGYDETLDWEVRDVPMSDEALERRLFVAEWNLWSTADEFLFEERRGRKIIGSTMIRD